MRRSEPSRLTSDATRTCNLARSRCVSRGCTPFTDRVKEHGGIHEADVADAAAVGVSAPVSHFVARASPRACEQEHRERQDHGCRGPGDACPFAVGATRRFGRRRNPSRRAPVGRGVVARPGPKTSGIPNSVSTGREYVTIVAAITPITHVGRATAAAVAVTAGAIAGVSVACVARTSIRAAASPARVDEADARDAARLRRAIGV